MAGGDAVGKHAGLIVLCLLLLLSMMLIVSTSVQPPGIVLATSDLLDCSFVIPFQMKITRRLSSILSQS